MNLKPIEPSDIIVGKPLLWDIYGFDRSLTLRKGKIVEDEAQLKEMAERGLLIEAHFADNIIRTPTQARQAAPVRHEPQVKAKEVPSVLRSIHQATKRMERLLYGLQTEADAQAHFLEVAKVIESAVTLNPEIALGTILLNQGDSHYAVRHGVDTAVLACLVAHGMQKPPEEITMLVAAALTMNVGMLRQQDTWQNKVGALSEPEWAIIKAHPKSSVDLLKEAGVDKQEWLDHVLLHHENEDGSGYPQGKAITELPQNTKILSFADRYCACVSQRQYRRTFLPGPAIRESLFAGGKPRDPMLAAYFVRELTNYPPGTMVRLHNGEIGVVTCRPKNGVPAVVHAVIGPRGDPLSIPLLRDTSKPTAAIVEAVGREHAILRFGMHQLWGEEAAL